jgi:hypothetical protein
MEIHGHALQAYTPALFHKLWSSAVDDNVLSQDDGSWWHAQFPPYHGQRLVCIVILICNDEIR